MSLTRAELDQGVNYWLTTRWPRDFHNDFYRCMADANPHGAFDGAWWADFLPVLHGWRATRPRRKRIPHCTRRRRTFAPARTKDARRGTKSGPPTSG